MNSTAARFLQVAASTAGLVVIGFVLIGHATKPARHGIPLPTDWSHQHVVFSRPATPEMAQKLSEDPRYTQQIYRRAMAERPLRLADGRIVSGAGVDAPARIELPASGKKKKENGLWSINIGSLTGSDSPGAGNYPAKFSFDTDTANCGTDYVVYSTGQTGSVTEPDIVAFNNIYSGCGGTVPSTYWAYNTAGSVLTSPALSLDGTQVAFAQTSTGGIGELILLRWTANAGDLTPPILTPLASTAAGYRMCIAPCMATFLLEHGTPVPTFANDTTSSVFIDFKGDIAWVGDSDGYLHKFTGVFKGTPAEAGAPFPVLVRPADPAPLTSPVFDSVSGLVFVGDTVGSLFSVNASTGSTQISSGVAAGVGLVESPMVDSASQKVYVFASSDGGTDCGGAPCATVSQFATGFLGGDTGHQITVGTGISATSTTGNPLYIGAFDSSYLDSTPPARNGYMYVCGNTGGSPTLYQIQFANGNFDAAAASEVTRLGTTTSTAACSPVTDFFNPLLKSTSPEHLYVSVEDTSREPACFPNGCMMSFIDTPWQPNIHYAVGQEIVDTNLQVETVMTAGTSGPGPIHPAWPGKDGVTVTDGGVTWIDQGFVSAGFFPAWTANTAFGTTGLRLIDSNNNFESVTTAGTTGAGPNPPIWPTTIGGTITDGTVVWTNTGASLRGALQITGGTTGVIIDNSQTSISGGSQVYFGTLANQTTCSTSGTGGACAVQASQAALQ